MKTSFAWVFIWAFTSGINAFAEFGDELHTFRSSDARPEDQFGASVGMDGNLAIFGAPFRDDHGNNSGAAYIFDVTTGTETLKLLPEDGSIGNNFGISVAISNNRAIVGATQSGMGAAYLFDATTGQQLHKLVAENGMNGDRFGISVDIDNDVAIVGANMTANGGLAYLFDVHSGKQIHVLSGNDIEPDARFGVSVAIDENRALVGARFDDEVGFRSGSAFLFDVPSGEQLHKLNAHDGYWGDRFGMYVDIDGNTAIVAARYDDDELKSSGSAYLFDVDTGEERFKIVADDADPLDHFGSGVSISGDLAIIGAIQDEAFGNNSGSAYVFDVNTGRQKAKLNSSDAGFFQQFGGAVAIDEGYAVVGATELIFAHTVDGLPSGRGYVFDVAVPEPTFGIGPLLAFFSFGLIRIGRLIRVN